MANYIDRELLCEAYTHLDIETFSDPEQRARLGEQLRDFFYPRAQFIFGEDVDIDIQFESGSLKTKIAVLGAVAGVIAGYGSFREGAEQMARDAVVLAQAANLEMVFRTRAANCDRIRIEKRSGVFGRISELLRMADILRDNSSRLRFPMSEEDLLDEARNVDALSRWNDDVYRLLNKVEAQETKACIAAGFLEELEKFPELLPWVEDAKNNSFRARLLAEDADLASRVDGLAAQYAKLLELIKKSLIDVMQPPQLG